MKFSEKVYSEYVRAALDALDKVCEPYLGGAAQGTSMGLTQNETSQIDGLTAKINLAADHDEAISLSNFSIVLRVLIPNITRLDNRACQGLASSIVGYRWLDVVAVPLSGTDATFVELYQRFLSVLVSSLPRYLNEVASKLVNEFPLVSTAENGSAGALTSQLHHTVLQSILKFVPTSVGTLPQVFLKGFPHHLASQPYELGNYVTNLLRVLEYCPEMGSAVWQMVIECCIKLDVELQNELDDLDDDEIEDLINGEEEIEERDTIGVAEEKGDDDKEDRDEGADNGAVSDGEEYLLDPVLSTGDIRKLSKKLDSIIETILTTAASALRGPEITPAGLAIFNNLSRLFQTHILPTHFTKLTQFLLFHISQGRRELADAFLVMLIDTAFSADEVLEKRIKAMQYLSSYIARAKTLSRDQVVFVVSYLMEWLNRYVQQRECEIVDHHKKAARGASASVGGMERFKLFYAAFQVLIYVFCFRHNMLLGASGNHWEGDIDQFFQRLIVTKFNPLKYCDETVVYIFAKIATKLDVCYCYSIIEHNKRERMLLTRGKNLPSAVYNFKLKQEFLDLEAYFPFDPIVLPNCKEIIAPVYVEWAEVNPTDDNDDEESGSYDQDDSDESITSDEED